MHRCHHILIAVLLVGAAALAGCAESDSDGTDDPATDTEEEPPEPGAQPKAVRVSPDTDSPTVEAGEPITFEGTCENPGWNLDRGEWSLQRPNETYPTTARTVDAPEDANPWGPESASFTFETTGQAVVQWSCRDTQNRATSVTWTVEVNTTPSSDESETYQPYSSEPFETKPPEGDLEVHFVDVGQGDGAVLHFPDTTVVYDAGRWSGDGETAVGDHLQAEGVTDVHALILSHPDADHAGGCDEILDALDVRYVFRPGIGSETQTWSDCENAIGAEGAPEYTDDELDPGHHLNLSAHASTRLLHVDSSASDPNAGSLALVVDYGDFELHLTGDATCTNEDQILDRGYGRDVELLKVAHHGSSTSTCTPWLDATQPEVGLVGVGADNSYGHPTDEVLTRLTDHGVDIYRTDQHGTVAVTTDGTDWSVTTENGDGPYNHSTDDTTSDGGGLAITDVQFDAPGDEYDNLNGEWVEITNQGDSGQDMTGWSLRDEEGDGHMYAFPDAYTLKAGASVKMHTGSGEDNSTELYWGQGAPVWDNGGDTARLFDGADVLVDSHSG